MTFEMILSAIGSIGFPIVCTCAIAWFFNKVNENYRADIKELTANHRDEVKTMVEAVNQNTLVIQKMCDILSTLDNNKT